MGSEKPGRKTPSVASQRRRLSDITNTTHSTSWTNSHDEVLPSQLPKGSSIQLQKEIVSLKKTLAEKAEIIEAQKLNIEKLWLNYCRKSRQNDEIIQHNGQLYKDLMQARDRLKILQHDNAQMAALHKISKSELQLKLTEALEHLDRFQGSRVTANSEKDLSENEDKQPHFSNVLCKLAQSRARRTLNASENSCESTMDCSTGTSEGSLENSGLIRTALRRRESLSYKEPSLKVKLRQEDVTTSQSKALSSGHEKSIEGLQNVYEDQELCTAASSTVTMSCSSEAETAEETSQSSSASVQSPEDNLIALSATISLKAGKSRHTQSMTTANSTESVHFSRRNSSGRPLRRVVGSVSSYKEAPLNIKMRRPE